MGKSTTITLVLAALAIAGCNRTSSPFTIETRSPPQSLPSVPAGEVQTSQLDPITGQPVLQPGQVDPNQVQPSQIDPNTGEILVPADGSNEVASLSGDAGVPAGQPLSREALLGSWNVPSDSPDCRAIISFTKWDGGYRAATRRCQSPELSSVTAWDVKGQQVVLVDGSGNTVARLYSSGSERYDGTTSGGNPISFSR